MGVRMRKHSSGEVYTSARSSSVCPQLERLHARIRLLPYLHGTENSIVLA